MITGSEKFIKDNMASATQKSDLNCLDCASKDKRKPKESWGRLQEKPDRSEKEVAYIAELQK